jgi:hypothetical protein
VNTIGVVVPGKTMLNCCITYLVTDVEFAGIAILELDAPPG